MKLRLKDLRLARGMTQREVADAAGMSSSYYTEIELGRKQINAHRMENIARALGVQPHELLLTGDPENDDLVRELRELSPEKKALVLNLIRSLRG